MMINAASASRNSVSHHGVRAGVSSLGAMANRSRVGGKSIRRGRGGIRRSNHHRAGKVIRPVSTSGSVKPSESALIMPIPPPGVRAPACGVHKWRRHRYGRAKQGEAHSVNDPSDGC